MKQILFIRHAQSAGNAGEKTANTQENPLTEKGKSQANDLASYLFLADNPDLVVCSKYQRAIDTMMPFIDCFPQTPMEEWPVHEFTYLSREKYANTSEQERLPAREEYWLKCDPDYVDGPGAESFSYFMDRVTDTIDLLMQRDEEVIYVFSHGWFIKALWWVLNNRPFRDVEWTPETMRQTYAFWASTPFPNTGILQVSAENDEISTSVWVMNEQRELQT